MKIMKRMLAFLLSVVLVWGLLPVCVAKAEGCDDEHTWDATTGKCIYCDAKCSHRWPGAGGGVKSAECNAVMTGLIKVVNVQYVGENVTATTGVMEFAVLVDMYVNMTGLKLMMIPVPFVERNTHTTGQMENAQYANLNVHMVADGLPVYVLFATWNTSMVVGLIKANAPDVVIHALTADGIILMANVINVA